MAAPTIAAAGTLTPGTDAPGSTQSFAKPSGVVNGSLLLAIYSCEHSTAGTLLSAPSGWTKAPDSDGAFQAVSSGTAGYAFYKIVVDAGSEPASYAMPVQDGRWRRGAVLRIAGHDPSSPFDGGDGAVAASNTSAPSTSVTTTGGDRLLIWHAASYNLSAWATLPTGFTELAAYASTSDVNVVAERVLVSASTFTTGGIATGASAGKAAWLGAIRPASSGTTYSKTGGAAGAGASSGAKSVIPANFINRAGGGAARGAASGARIVTVPKIRSGGGTARAAGSGAKTVIVVPPLPSDVLDLSYWHLTTPEDEGDGTAEQIDQPALDSYESTNFYVDEDGLVVCIAPVDGYSTSSSSGATRMELRQHRKSGYANAAMDPNGSGRWQMTITTSADPTSIAGGSNPRQELIIAQIHGAGDSPIPLILSAEWTSGGNPVTPRVRIFKNGPGLANIITGITTSTRLSIRIRIDADAGRLKVWGVAGERTALPSITDSTPYDWPISDFTDQEGWYYKAGAYNKTTITSGSSGEGIAKISYLNVLEPGDPEEPTSVTYSKTGGAAPRGAGSGAKTLVPATVHAKAGGAAAAGAGSGARVVTPAAVHARAGGAAVLGAGSAARATTSATTYSRTGSAAASSASSGAVVRDSATVYVELGGAATGSTGSGSVELVQPAVHERTGGAAASTSGAGARLVSHTYATTGGAATTGAGSGAKDVTSIHKTGGGAARGAGSGDLQTGGGVTYARTGGASASAAGTGSRATQSATVYDRAAGASTSVVGSGVADVQPAVVHTHTGGAIASAAGTGAAEHVPAVRHDRAGGAVSRGVGSGSVDLTAGVVHVKAGGASAASAGTGTQEIGTAEVHVRTGGGAAQAAGIALIEVIPAAVHVKAGGAVALGAGSARGRVGGRFHAAVPVAVGQLRSGTPVRR